MLNSCVLSKVAASKRGFVKDVTGSITFCSPLALAFALAFALVSFALAFALALALALVSVLPFLSLVPPVLAVISMLDSADSVAVFVPQLGFLNEVTSADSILDLLPSASRAILSRRR